MYSWLEKTFNNYLKMHSLQRVSHAVLICAADGLGVGQLSREIARVQLCLENGSVDCTCHSCTMLRADTHPDFNVLNKGDNLSISVEQLRNSIETLETTATNDHGKVLLIEEANNMTVAASNALLKTLEEPPRNSFIILTTSNVSSLLPTIISRTMRLQVTVPPMYELNSFLQELTHTNQDYRLELAISGMSPLKVNDYITQGISPKLHEAVKLFVDVLQGSELSMSFVNFLDKQLNAELVFSLLYTLLKDVMLFQNGAKIDSLYALNIYPDAVGKLSRIHPDSISSAMNRIIALKQVPGMKTSPVNNLQLAYWLNLLTSV